LKNNPYYSGGFTIDRLKEKRRLSLAQPVFRLAAILAGRFPVCPKTPSLRLLVPQKGRTRRRTFHCWDFTPKSFARQ
jgi:hypothetical protein